ncbi:uncharacterized protein LOC135122298 [Zophobas morio]|uniref:uncharacterized protein LOC135122298 n=1 Tax=Zophobas morio TaxID=2755281 RepID=UPI003083CC7D
MDNKGKPYTEIARKCSVSKATISRIKAHYNPDRPCSEPGRPKVLKNRDVARLVRQVTLGAIESAHKASKIIGTTLDQPVSRSTAFTSDLALSCKEERKFEPSLTGKKVIFSDETRTNRYGGSDAIRWHWKRSGDNRILVHQVVQMYKHGRGSIMIWSCITSKGVAYLGKVTGGITAGTHLDIIKNDLARRCVWYGFVLVKWFFSRIMPHATLHCRRDHVFNYSRSKC